MTLTIDFINKEKKKNSSSHFFNGISNTIECVVNEYPKTDNVKRTAYKIDKRCIFH